MPMYVCECEWGMRDWDEPEQMPKSGLFGVCLVKCGPSIADIFFFEVPTPNIVFGYSPNIRHTNECCSQCPLLYFHINITHLAFAYRCGRGFTIMWLLTQDMHHNKPLQNCGIIIWIATVCVCQTFLNKECDNHAFHFQFCGMWF